MPSKMRAEHLGILWCFRESLAQHIFDRAGRQLSTFEGMRDAFSCKRVDQSGRISNHQGSPIHHLFGNQSQTHRRACQWRAWTHRPELILLTKPFDELRVYFINRDFRRRNLAAHTASADIQQRVGDRENPTVPGSAWPCNDDRNRAMPSLRPRYRPTATEKSVKSKKFT